MTRVLKARHPAEFVRAAWRRIERFGEHIVPGSVLGQAVYIDRIACPLRYDICVRIDFLRLLRDEWALYERDFDSFRQRPAVNAYFAWFRDIRCVNYEPTLLHDQTRLEASFVKRIRQTAVLWQSVERIGFDTSHPIRLSAGRSVENIHGKSISGGIFAGDGCHRIACLYLLGWRRLEPPHYEVAVRSRLKPFDNTATLIESKALDLASYLRYISQFYCDGMEFDTADSIRQHVAERKPELLAELQSVLAYDLTRLGSHE